MSEREIPNRKKGSTETALADLAWETEFMIPEQRNATYRRKGFVPDGKGSWSMPPRRVVSLDSGPEYRSYALNRSPQNLALEIVARQERAARKANTP